MKEMLFWNRDLESYDRRMGPMGGFCHNPSAFEDILSTYGLAARPTAYWQVSRPMCFKHAVFVGASGRASAREALTYAAGQMGADACPPVPVTIMSKESEFAVTLPGAHPKVPADAWRSIGKKIE